MENSKNEEKPMQCEKIETDLKETYSAPEVAELLGVPLSTLNWRIRNGKILVTRDPFSRRYIISRKEVERLLSLMDTCRPTE
jgi:excisionase family DNA binding protein